ncbi:MAG: PadR family transcriptional regulator [Firmicutes bacterium]|nr:PadR family transcriptional regulator [Bacillota bacterium]
MGIDKSLLTSSTIMLLLKLLEEKDMYGYMMIEELSKKSDNTFSLKAGTLYPLLHTMEEKELVTSYYSNSNNGRQRKYYSITKKGKGHLKQKKEEWQQYSCTVNKILKGGMAFAY